MGSDGPAQSQDLGHQLGATDLRDIGVRTLLMPAPPPGRCMTPLSGPTGASGRPEARHGGR